MGVLFMFTGFLLMDKEEEGGKECDAGKIDRRDRERGKKDILMLSNTIEIQQIEKR